MSTITLTAPAKLNLMLLITGQRDDGYHNLQTIFQLLDFGDELSFSKAREIEFSCNLKSLSGEDNLVVKAAKALQKATNSNQGAKIHLTKTLPFGGGVGGGSSDCATTLLALNKLWNLSLSIEELSQIGLSLGADVPVFVKGKSAFAQGVGEQLTPMDLPNDWFLVIKPDAHVSTGEIFSHPQLTRDSASITMRTAFERGGHNDFEFVVRQLYSNVDKTFDWLETYPHANLSPALTGTGACVYVKFQTREQAIEVLKHLPPELTGFVAQGVNTSLTHQALDLL